MQNLRRQPNRKARRRAALQPVDPMPPMAELAIVAGDSLELSDDEITDALNALSGFTPPGELSDTLQARLLELAELVQGRDDAPAPLRLACASLDLAEARAQLERRRGVGFVARVAAMGKPAAAALAGMLLALLVWLLPSSAAAAPPYLATAAFSSHNVSRTRRRLFALALRNSALWGTVSGPFRWIRSNAKSGNSLRPSTYFRASVTGFAHARRSSRAKAKTSRSSWSGGVDTSASEQCRTAIRTSRSSARTARSSARPGCNASSAGEAGAAR